MNVQEIKIIDLKFAEYNPRTISKEEFEGLKASLKKYGQVENIIVNKDMTIISGHQRTRAWQALGNTTIMAYVLDLNKHEEKKLNVLMNSHAISGKYDDVLLSEILEELKLDDDYAELRLDVLEPLDLSEEVDAEEDDYEEPEHIQTDIVLGDLFEFRKDGKALHRLLCGDSTSVDDVEKLMNGEKADMVFTDPPYGANMGIQNDKANEFKQVFSDFISILPCNDNIYVCSDWRCVGFFINEIEDNDYEIYNLVVWVKNLFGQGKLYHTKHEEIIFCGKGNYRKDKLNDDVNVWAADSVRNFAGSKNAQEAVGHPTQKPVEICSRAINNSSIKNEIVYDGFIGSGSTMVASHQLNRRCYGLELDPKYCQVIIDRMKKLDPELEVIKL